MVEVYSIEDDTQINPTELKKALKHFNWGAFCFAWIWGLGNGSLRKTWYIFIFDLLLQISSLIPVICPFVILISLGIRIFYGINGNIWAYEGRAWYSIEDFVNTQQRWAKMASAVISAIVMAILFLLLLVFLVGVSVFNVGGQAGF